MSSNTMHKSLNHWLSTALASIVYIIANAIDYSFTIHGMAQGRYQEWNPIARKYMELFGNQGLLFYKTLLSVMLIIGVIVVDIAYRKHGIRFKASYFLYGGSILVIVGGSLWSI